MECYVFTEFTSVESTIAMAIQTVACVIVADHIYLQIAFIGYPFCNVAISEFLSVIRKVQLNVFERTTCDFKLEEKRSFS